MPEERQYPYELEERLRKNSLSGREGQRTRERKIRMKYKDFIRTLKIIAISSAIAASIVIGAGAKTIDYIHDTMIINQLTSEFQRDCINPETHRTLDNQHYYYDYGDIADYCEEMGDFDLGIYLFCRNAGDYQTGRVLEYTPYKSLDGYLEAHNWESADDWKKDMRERIVLAAEADEKEAELARMRAEHQSQIVDQATLSANENDFGGAK